VLTYSVHKAQYSLLEPGLTMQLIANKCSIFNGRRVCITYHTYSFKCCAIVVVCMFLNYTSIYAVYYVMYHPIEYEYTNHKSGWPWLYRQLAVSITLKL